MTADREILLRSLYDAFNARDIDTVVAAMSPDVDWPNGWEGGRVVGHDAVRHYWERQWAEIPAQDGGLEGEGPVAHQLARPARRHSCGGTPWAVRNRRIR